MEAWSRTSGRLLLCSSSRSRTPNGTSCDGSGSYSATTSRPSPTPTRTGTAATKRESSMGHLHQTSPPTSCGARTRRPANALRSPSLSSMASTGPRRSIAGFWVLPKLRRTGAGRELALEMFRTHPGPWLIGFQHNNTSAGPFWRSLAEQAFRRAAVDRNPVTDRLPTRRTAGPHIISPP